MKKIFILGSLNMDLAIKSNRFPVEGETIKGEDFQTCPGGKGLNQAIAITKLGGSVSFLGAVGSDSFGLEMRKELDKFGIDISHVKILEGVSSGIAVIMVVDGNNRIILDLGANKKISRDDVEEFLNQAKEGDIFLAQLENNIDAVLCAITIAKRKRMTVIVNPAPMDANIKNSIKSIDYLIPNEVELHELNKDAKLSNAYSLIGVSALLVTLGDKGYFYQDKNVCIQDYAKRVKVVDTTGAGDSFVGAFAYCLSIDKDINYSLNFASSAAALSVTKRGSSRSLPTIDEVLNFMSLYK